MRTGVTLSVCAAELERLRALVNDRNAAQKHAWRARIVLLSGEGLDTNAIMRETGKSKTCVWRWQERFAAEGLGRLVGVFTHDDRGVICQNLDRGGIDDRRKTGAYVGHRQKVLDRNRRPLGHKLLADQNVRHPPRAATSCMLETVFSNTASRGAMTMTGIDSSISAIGPSSTRPRHSLRPGCSSAPSASAPIGLSIEREGFRRVDILQEPRPPADAGGRARISVFAARPRGGERAVERRHFSIDGTLLRAWASMKSFRPKDGSGEPPSPGRNGEADFRKTEAIE
jgi:hypothetical protein